MLPRCKKTGNRCGTGPRWGSAYRISTFTDVVADAFCFGTMKTKRWIKKRRISKSTRDFTIIKSGKGQLNNNGVKCQECAIYY